MNLRRMCILLLLDGVSWIFTGRTDAETEAPILWPLDGKSWLIRKDWCWERLKAGGEGGDRGWNGWMASLTQWTWVWTTSGRWWRTRKPGMLQSMGSKRVRHDWATEQQGFYNCHLDPADWWCCSIQLNPYWFSACWVCQLLIE